MKFDYIIIGGGLSGLSAGIRLASKGKKTAIVSSGQSALHFCSGALGLLGKDREGKCISNPIEAIRNLPENHPYKLISADNLEKIASEVPAILEMAGVTTTGSFKENHFTLSPFGLTRPSWLTMKGYPVFGSQDKLPFRKVLIVNLTGFLEFYPDFIAHNLAKKGVECRIETISLKRFAGLCKSDFGMRATSIARLMDDETLREFADRINSLVREGETVFIPSVIGFNSESQIDKICQLVKAPLNCIPTLPVSVAGLRTQNLLERYFEKCGGTFILGDRVDKGYLNGNNVAGIATTNFGEDLLEAKAYILTTGSLFGEGIIATPDGFYEPVFGLDVNYNEDRDNWCDPDFFAPQPYMQYGVEVDSLFHPSVKGKRIDNLFAAGAALAHCNSLKEDSGAGTAIITGIHVADLAMDNFR